MPHRKDIDNPSSRPDLLLSTFPAISSIVVDEVIVDALLLVTRDGRLPIQVKIPFEIERERGHLERLFA